MLQDDKGLLPGSYVARLVEVHVVNLPSERHICSLSIDGPIAVEVTEEHDSFNSVEGRCYRVGSALLAGYDKLASIRLSPSHDPNQVCAYLSYDVSRNQPGEHHPDHRIHMGLIDLVRKVEEAAEG